MAYDTSNSFVFYYPVNPSNTNPSPGKQLYVGATGDVTLVPEPSPENPNPIPVLFPAVQAGTRLPVAFVQIRATGTSATGLVALVS